MHLDFVQNKLRIRTKYIENSNKIKFPYLLTFNIVLRLSETEFLILKSEKTF